MTVNNIADLFKWRDILGHSNKTDEYKDAYKDSIAENVLLNNSSEIFSDDFNGTATDHANVLDKSISYISGKLQL